jgi:hypothetical protein
MMKESIMSHHYATKVTAVGVRLIVPGAVIGADTSARTNRARAGASLETA